jgi:hypothetical protein
MLYTKIPPFLPLGATAQDELWPPEQSASILLHPSEADCVVSEQFSFYGVGLLASSPAWRTNHVIIFNNHAGSSVFPGTVLLNTIEAVDMSTFE